jgi:hypothetical protein
LFAQHKKMQENMALHGSWQKLINIYDPGIQERGRLRCKIGSAFQHADSVIDHQQILQQGFGTRIAGIIELGC